MTTFVIVFNSICLVYCVGLFVFGFIKRHNNKKKALNKLNEDIKDEQVKKD